MKTHKFLVGLLWYEKELPLEYVVEQCATRFGSMHEGLYVIADAMANGDIEGTSKVLKLVK